MHFHTVEIRDDDAEYLESMRWNAAAAATEIGADDNAAAAPSRTALFAKIAAVVLACSLLVTLAGCGGGSEEGAATEDQPEPTHQRTTLPPQCSQPKACA